jgi:beta-galactosidase/beta-glucuronidase
MKIKSIKSCRLAAAVASVLSLLPVLPATGLRAEEHVLRQSINFNREWTFQLGDVSGAEAASFDDTTWDNTNLPHSFSMPYSLSDKFYTGYGWYRKHFDVPAAWTRKRINLEFDGVFQVAEVFVNGKRVGEHKGGYTGFTFDITDAAKTGGNVVVVRVNNLRIKRRLIP